LHPPSVIEQKSRQIAISNYGETQELADEVFKAHHIVGPLADVASPMLHQIIDAQIKFDQGNLKPVTEEQIAAGINHIATVFSAPVYAFTDSKEVRKTRVLMSTIEPHFIGRKPLISPRVRSPKDHQLLDNQMGPLEAFHVSATILEQKFTNPDYQVTPEERAEADGRGDLHALSIDKSAQRFHEMQALITLSTKKISLMDIFQLSVDSMKVLGVSQDGSAK